MRTSLVELLFGANLIQSEILVPTLNNSTIVGPVSPNCRQWRRCEKSYPRHNNFID